MSKISIDIINTANEFYTVIINVKDTDLLNKSAEFTVEQDVKVKDSRAVNDSQTILRKKVQLTHKQTELKISKEELTCYAYHGSMINIKTLFKVRIDDGFFFDTKTSTELNLDEDFKPAVVTKAHNIVDPKDLFSFTRNFKAISASNQLKTIGLLIVGGIIILINSIVGFHDQFATESETYFYSHTNSDGESQSPLVAALTGSGFLGLMIWLAIKRQLKKYMTFNPKALPEKIKPGDKIKASDLVSGNSRVNIENAIFRVIACNHERGQYRRGSGSNVRTVSFQNPIQAIVLHEEKIPHLRKRTPFSQHLNGSIKFTEMFNTLYPPQMISHSHGIEIHWEIQLLHDDFVDQEIRCATHMFDHKDFYEIHSMEEDVSEDQSEPENFGLFKNV